MLYSACRVGMTLVYSISSELLNFIRWGFNLHVFVGSACHPEEVVYYKQQDAGTP